MGFYTTEDFKSRVDYAARVISARRPTSRRFCTCFEMDDGDEVAAVLWNRVRKNPSTKLAKNIAKYLVPQAQPGGAS